MKQIVVSVIVLLALSGCATAPNTNQRSMSASFYDMKEDVFSLQAIAPSKVIREYAICKAIWFAEKKNATKLSLGDPVYNKKTKEHVPEGWAVVDATAYLAKQSPNGNPFISVREMAATCRNGWDWYQ